MYVHINLDGLIRDYERGVLMSRGIIMESNKSDEEEDFEKLRVAGGCLSFSQFSHTRKDAIK